MTTDSRAALPFDSAVIISPFFWNKGDEMPQTTHYVARQLARLCPTILVEPPVQCNVWSEEFRMDRVLHAVFSPHMYSSHYNLSVFRRGGIPFGRLGWVREATLALTAAHLKKAIRELNFRRTLLWHSFPYWSQRLVDAVSHRVFAYHCLDYSERPEEEELVKQAHVVFAVSAPLVKRHSLLNQRTYLLPNGVDLDMFDRERAAERDRPKDLPTTGRLIGFIGSINCHLDIELLVRVARSFPADHLVLLGRISKNETAPRANQAEAMRALLNLPNVRFLGFRQPARLADYLYAFDVCLIPHLTNSFNAGRDPNKFYQHLAMGKAVVTTPVAVAERYRDLCYVADSPGEFIDQICAALREGDAARIHDQRVAAARLDSWEARMAEACEILSGIVGRDGKGERAVE